MAEASRHKPQRPASYADLEAVPPHVVAEILAGELATHPRPMPRHATAQNSLSEELTGPFQKRRGGGPGVSIFMTEPQLGSGEHVAIPDIAGWRRERMAHLPEQASITLPPDWICELLSPGTASYDRTVRFRIYHQYRVGHLWSVDPAYRTLEVFAWSEGHWVPTGNFRDFEDVAASPFEAITFNLGQLWPFDEPPSSET